MAQVTINGTQYDFLTGTIILRALQSVGIDVPTLCDDLRLHPDGACRLCLVHIDGVTHPVTACNTPISDGMVIYTNTPELEQSRHTNLRLLAANYPAEAVQGFPDKPLHRLFRRYGITNGMFKQHIVNLVDDSHPYIRVDMERCIYCYRCVRICNEVQGQFVWRVWNRGDATRIVPDSNTTLRESSCVSCGACVDSCPSGALEDVQILKHGTPTDWTKTTCPYCGVGCELNVGTRDRKLVTMRPPLEAPVNKGHLCVKGRYAFDFVYSNERLTDPMLRKNGDWQKVPWPEAISAVANGFKRIVEQYGADSVGVLGSARATNEENYLAQKFARVVLGTNNVDCCARVCHAPTAAAMKQMLGTGAATNSYDDIEHAKTIMLCGTNATENHPIVGARIKQAHLRGAHLIVLDPREIELARYADIHLPLRLGTNVPLFNAMACTIVEEKLYDRSAVAERVSGWDQFCNFIRTWTPERVASICQIKPDLIREAARLYAVAKPSICFHGLGMTEHVQGTESVMCLVNLALLTGNFGKSGTGINPLRGQNNVQGSAHMGCEPANLTGYTPLAQSRERFEQIWNKPVPSRPGLNLMQMIDAAAAGNFKALWAIGYDVALTNPNATNTKQSLDQLELLVVQDFFPNEIMKHATVFLPACSSYEKDGTFMNAERRIQRVRRVIDPLGNSKADWEIICDVAKAMGHVASFNFNSPRDIWDEIRKVWQAGHGITYERIETHGLQWPCPTDDHPGTTILHGDSFPIGKRAQLQCIHFRPGAETISSEFPLLLTTGRTLYQFNAGTMTAHTPNTELRPSDLLDISLADSEQLHLKTGETARVISQFGEARLPVQVNPAMKRGELFATFHTTNAFINRVTNPARDNHVDTPEYKVVAVRLEKV